MELVISCRRARGPFLRLHLQLMIASLLAEAAVARRL